MNLRSSYSLSATSGVMAAGLAADSEIFQWRWTDATRVCVPRRVRCNGGGIIAFAAGYGEFRMNIARAWTADGTGGTAIASAVANDQKKRTAMTASLFEGGTVNAGAGVRIASSAALGAGTKTLDTNAFANNGFGVTVTAGTSLGYADDIWRIDSVAKDATVLEYPLVLAQNEGFVIAATVPATGTWTFQVTIDWIEFDTLA